MWVRMNEEELRYDRRGNIIKKILLSILLFVLCVILSLVFLTTGYSSKYGQFYPPKTWNEIVSQMPMVLFVSFLTFIIVLAFFVIRNKKLKTVICVDCQKQKKEDSEYSCECGGKFESIDLLKWIEEGEMI